eukprot:scaffold651427_cov59-Attheya_sp.AAC.1
MTNTAPRLFSSHFPNDKSQQLFQKKKEDGSSSSFHWIFTYLEINGFLMTASFANNGDGDGDRYNGVTLLVDPILEGPLDFGIPDWYCAQRKCLPHRGLCALLPHVDGILITQGLDDHAHVPTLTQLASMNEFANIPIVTPPSARRALQQSGFLSKTSSSNIQFLRPGQQTTLFPTIRKNSEDRIPTTSITTNNNDDSLPTGGISITATTGALVGPPWQARENGYILRPTTLCSMANNELGGAGRASLASVYIEPHVEFNPKELQTEAPIDIVVTPIVGQGIGALFDLVHGPNDTIRLVDTLQPKLIIPMPNGNVQSKGFLSPFIQPIGSVADFCQGLKKSKHNNNDATTKVMDLIPGQDHIIHV